MKRRDPEVEARRLRTRRDAFGGAICSLGSAAFAGVLGFGVVLVIGVLLHGYPRDGAEWRPAPSWVRR